MIYTIFNIVIAGVYEVGVSGLTIMVAVVIVICSVCIINRCLDKIGSLVNVT